MDLIWVILLFLLGLVLIVKGGDFFVDAATWIAEVSGIPKFIIGATVVSFATTLPELIVSLIAAAEGSNGMAIGNAVGSVTANIGLIMGISLVCLPAIIQRSKLAFKGIIMCMASALLAVFCLGGELKIWSSFIMLAIFAAFLWENITDAKKAMGTEKVSSEKPDRKTIIINTIKFILGAAGIVVGAQLLVDYGSELARVIGVPESIIGVTLVAIGTSLPELVTTITAIAKKQASLSVGNIIGANIIDLTVILPLCAIVSGKALPVSAQSYTLDMPVCFGVCLLAIVPALISQRFKKWQGVALLCIYVAYVVVLCTFFV